MSISQMKIDNHKRDAGSALRWADGYKGHADLAHKRTELLLEAQVHATLALLGTLEKQAEPADCGETFALEL